jgi:nickel transport protein
MNIKWKLITGFIFALALCLVLPIQAYAHGARIEYVVDMAIEIVAMYDNGEPMGGAQVMVYAPDDLTDPWLTGLCDDEGRFTFVPDGTKPGTWDVQVRQAGHGDIVHIPVGEGAVSTESSGGYSTLQIVLMSVCVIWGIIGTALYLSRRKA